LFEIYGVILTQNRRECCPGFVGLYLWRTVANPKAELIHIRCLDGKNLDFSVYMCENTSVLEFRERAMMSE
jgi:hypothetical protein